MATERPVTESQQQILRSQVFDALHPGALLHDFAVVLDFIGTKGVKSAGKYNMLPIAAIPKLDEQLAQPLRVPLERPQLRSHPYLQGLHLLGRASGLLRVSGSGGKARLVIDPVAFGSWNSLNPTEQYFALLEAWLLYAHPEMVGETRSGKDNFLRACLGCWHQLGQNKSRSRHALASFHDYLILDWELYHVALFDLFGLIEVAHSAKPVLPWEPVRTALTPFGAALLACFGDPRSVYQLKNELFGEEEHETEEPETDEEEHETEEPETDKGESEESEEGEEVSWMVFDRMRPLFAPYFPHWQNNLEIPGPEQREGVFVFRVSLGEVWRLIAISSENTLDDLAAAILDSVKFDFDHLYEFTYRDRFGGPVRATHPRDREGKPADEVLIGELPLQPGETLPFMYDYGDSWHFDARLERIDPPNRRMKKPRVLEKHGKSPKQYPDEDW